MSMKFPSFASYLKTKFVSGCISIMWFLNALESIANNWLSTKFLIVDLVLSPSMDVITCFNLVDTPADAFSFIFLRPFISASIALSSLWVKNLNVISFLDVGKVKGNSFLPSLNKDSSKTLSSILVKSIFTVSPLY